MCDKYKPSLAVNLVISLDCNYATGFLIVYVFYYPYPVSCDGLLGTCGYRLHCMNIGNIYRLVDLSHYRNISTNITPVWCQIQGYYHPLVVVTSAKIHDTYHHGKFWLWIILFHEILNIAKNLVLWMGLPITMLAQGHSVSLNQLEMLAIYISLNLLHRYASLETSIVYRYPITSDYPD